MTVIEDADAGGRTMKNLVCLLSESRSPITVIGACIYRKCAVGSLEKHVIAVDNAREASLLPTEVTCLPKRVEKRK